MLSHNSFDIQDIFHELLIECGNITDLNQDILNSIDEKLRIKINEVKLENLKTTISNIEFFPDSEILKLLDVLIELTAIKMKFSYIHIKPNEIYPCRFALNSIRRKKLR